MDEKNKTLPENEHSVIADDDELDDDALEAVAGGAQWNRVRDQAEAVKSKATRILTDLGEL